MPTTLRVLLTGNRPHEFTPGLGPPPVVTPVTSPEQARALLEQLSRRPPPPYRERLPPDQRPLGELLKRLGRPQDGLKVIHIAGSKGKGSVALLTEAILQAAGFHTGTFTSPHLERWTERLRLDGREIDPATLVTLLEKLRPHLAALDHSRPEEPLGFFDTLTAGALTLFRDSTVDYALMEVGLGGRLDATNVVSPKMTCITAIELEHTEQLGPTLGSIAREKAGIVKSGAPLVTGRLPRAADRVVAARARSRSAPWLRLGQEITVAIHREDETGQDLEIGYRDWRAVVRLPLTGRHQAHNAALAAACVAGLGCLEAAAWAEAVTRGLANVLLPGRVEFLARRPWIVADGAHTRASSRALVRALAPIPARHIRLLLSASSHAHLAAVCPALLPLAGRVIVTRADPHRSLPAPAVAGELGRHYPDLTLEVIPDPRAALQEATRALGPDELLLAAGSVYLAGLLRAHLSPPTPSQRPNHPQPDEVTRQ